MTDFEQMQGGWHVEKLEQNGQSAPDAALLRTVIIKDDKLYLRFLMKSEKRGYGDIGHGFTLDSARRPKVIETTDLEDGSKRKGIYEIGADTLMFCWSRVDGDCPTEFTAHEGSNQRLFVLSRIKKAAR